MKTSVVLICLIAFSACARDPFTSEQSERCPPASEADRAWRLQGTIGQRDRFEAWLISPGNKRLHVKAHDRLAGTSWWVKQIELLRITLADGSACQAPLRLQLQGENDVKE